MLYHGTTIIKTGYTTTVYKSVRGHTYAKDMPLYRLEGALCKDAVETPRLHSVQECKDYIKEKENEVR